MPAPGVLGNDTGLDTDPLTAVLVTTTAHGTLALNANGSFTYTPAANYFGTDTFAYQASDGQAASNTATVTITVTPVNDTAVAANDAYATAEDTALSVPAPGVLGNDTDADGDALTAAVVASPMHGTLTLNADGSFTYTPAANYAGSDSFTYRANDGQANSNTATVTLTVNAVTLTVTDDGGLTASATTSATIGAQALSDLDIKKFSASKNVMSGKRKQVTLKLTVMNTGMLGVATAQATVVGIQGGTEVYRETLTVSDLAGGGRSTFVFPPYKPTAGDDITWTAIVNDDDPDIDAATATTTVRQARTAAGGGAGVPPPAAPATRGGEGAWAPSPPRSFAPPEAGRLDLPRDKRGEAADEPAVAYGLGRCESSRFSGERATAWSCTCGDRPRARDRRCRPRPRCACPC